MSIALLLLAGAVRPAAAQDATPERWVVDSHVLLPAAAVVGGIDGVGGGLVGGWTIQLVLDCEVLGIQRECAVEDAALSVLPFRADAASLAPHVERLEEALRGARFRMEQRDDGRLTSWEVYGLDQPDRSYLERDSLGVLLQRAVVGFELAAPRLLTVDRAVLEPWLVRDPLLARLPSLDASQGRVDLELRPTAADDTWLRLSVGGRGTVRTGVDDTVLAARFAGEALVDGYGFERVAWWGQSVPLAEVGPRLIRLRMGGSDSYGLADLTTGAPLSQGGTLRRLAPDESVVLTATDPVSPPTSPGRTLVDEGPGQLDGWMGSGDAERIYRATPPILSLGLGGRGFQDRASTGTVALELSWALQGWGRVAVGARGELPTQLDPAATGVRSGVMDQQLRAGGWWNPALAVSPLVGLAVSGGLRGFQEGDPAWVPAVAVGPDVGVSWSPGDALRLALHLGVEHELIRVRAERDVGEDTLLAPWSGALSLTAGWRLP